MRSFCTCRRALLFTAVAAAAGVLSSLQAAKPTAPPPPPPPPDPFVIYEWRPELGGWLDKQTNLVWGYSSFAATGSWSTFSWANGVAADYSGMLSDAADALEARADYSQGKANDNYALWEQAVIDGDEVDEAYYWDRYVRYQALADAQYADVPEFQEAALDAAQFTNWRLPSKAEAVDALNKGLFSYGAGKFNSYDCSPGLGNQGLANGGVTTWTSDTAKTGGKAGAWVFYPGNSVATMLVTQTSGCDTIVVRKHVP
jgi:hypothetical protein